MALAGYSVVLEVSKIYPDGKWGHEVLLKDGDKMRVKLWWGEDGIYMAQSPAWKDPGGRRFPIHAFHKFDEVADYLAEELRK